MAVFAPAANPPPSQVYYVPFPEDNQLEGFVGVTSDAVDPLAVFVNIAVSNDNTVIYHDHWEDGYEADVTNPKQASTEEWGDGNPANGYPPGNPGDQLSAGTVFSLRNYVNSTAGASVLKYDARDKIASSKPITVTKTCFPASTNTLLAGSIEVFEQGLWGTEYRTPVGVNMPTSTATSSLTYDADMFAYSALSIMAGAGGATVQIDGDNNGAFEQTLTLAEGGTTYVAGVNIGARVVSDKPVQVVLFTGRPDSSYQSRDTSLVPISRWSSSYYAPVSTVATSGSAVFLYNPGASAITVSYAYRSSASAYVTATLNVPAGGNARVTLDPSDSTHFGAYHFYTTGTIPPVFYAFCAVDGAGASVGNNQAFDGGFTLIAQPSLTTQVQVSLGIGRDPYSTTYMSENGNPVWITTVGNGHTPETVYVDYNGDNAGPLTDPNGRKYDVAYSLRELQQQKIFDPDGEQSGMAVYTLNPNVEIAAAWAQDPAVTSAGQPGLDVATMVLPLREGDAAKRSTVVVDADGDGHCSAGDTLEYDIRVINTARSPIAGPFTVKDPLPANTTYVVGTTQYRYSVNGAWQAWQPVPDDASGTAYPLDGAGYAFTGALGYGQQIQVVLRALIDSYPNLSAGTRAITNTGTVLVMPYGLTVGFAWTDLLYGSIGDRVWTDANGNGIQDAGEIGLNGVIVYADINNNARWDSGEPTATTAGDGTYVLTGLLAATHTVRVNPASVAALNPGLGPTYDLDGIATSYVASVTLAAAQDRLEVDFGLRVGASFGGRVWMDRDGDGERKSGEPGLNGVRVYVDSNSNGACDVGEPNSITFGDGNYFIGNVTPGTYKVRVDTTSLPSGATATFDPDGIATANQASVTLVGAEHNPNVDFGYRGSLSIGDLVWEDVNADGAKAVTGEPGMANIRVYIDGNGNGVWDNTEAFAMSNASGIYSLGNLLSGTHVVRVDAATLPPSMFETYDLTSPTTDDQATVSLSGTSRTDVDFGYRNDATMGHRVWNDPNNNGVQDPGEPGIEGVLVYIDADGDGLFDQGVERYANTDVNGNYTIKNLSAGTYVVRVEVSTLPQGSTQTYDLDGTATANGVTRILKAREDVTDVNFGYRSAASVGDFVWHDANGDGVQNAGETGINGVRVYLDVNGNGLFDSATEPSAMTAGNGAYSITGLVAGTYTARLDASTLPAGVVETYDLTGALDNAATFMLSANQMRTDLDFGYVLPVAMGDRVWHDLNANGVQDIGEPGLDGCAVTVCNAAANTVAGTTTTAGGGAYSFNSLLPGTYYIEFGTIPGYARSLADQGADATKDSDASAGTGLTGNYVLASGVTNNTIDAGYFIPGIISGSVLADANNDNIGEAPLNGVTLTLKDGSGNDIDSSPSIPGIQPTTATTATNGSYSFTGLLPGNYQVVETDPSGYISLTPNQVAVIVPAGGGGVANFVNSRLADLAITKTVDKGKPLVGSEVVFTLTATNHGPSAATGVNVTEVLPGGYQFVSANPAAAYSAGVWTIGGLANGASVPLRITVKVNATGNYTNTASVTGKERDSNETNNADSEGTVPIPLGTCHGHLYVDTNGNGTRNSGEPDLANMDVIVTDVYGIAQTVTTQAGGNWTAIVPPGQTRVKVDKTHPQYPHGFTPTEQTEGTDPTDVMAVSDADVDAGNDGFYLPGIVSGHVYKDTNLLGADIRGHQDPGESDLPNMNIKVTDSTGKTHTVTTDVAGNWTLKVPPGITVAANDATDPDFPRGEFNGETYLFALSEGTDPTTVSVLAGLSPVAQIDGYADPRKPDPATVVSLGGRVFDDMNKNGIQDADDTGLAGVLVSLYRPGSGPDGFAGTADDAQALATQTPPADGAYAFSQSMMPPDIYLAPGVYQVGFAPLAGHKRTLADAGPDDTKDSDAGAATGLTDKYVLGWAEDKSHIDAGYYRPGSLGDRVWFDKNHNGVFDSGDSGLPGIRVELYTSKQIPGVDTPEKEALTNALGIYGFTDLDPDAYVVYLPTAPDYPLGLCIQQNPDDDRMDNDSNGIQPVFGGPVRSPAITLVSGESDATIDIGFACYGTWQEWQALNALGGNSQPDDNPDEDACDNLIEYAFRQAPGSGAGDVFSIKPSTPPSGNIEATFTRPLGVTADVTYYLEYGQDPGNPANWISIPLKAISSRNLVVTPISPCTESVTIRNFEARKGCVRFRAELDTDGDAVIDHIARTGVEGWTETVFNPGTRSYNDAYLHAAVFSGTVDSSGGVAGQTLHFKRSAGGVDLASLLTPGVAYYLEVSAGENEGQRFDVDCAGGSAVTLATDGDPYAGTPPFNTRSGALPANLAGDRVSIRRHRLLGEVFPVTNFFAAAVSGAADQVQTYAADGWTTYWLFTNGGAPKWVKEGDATLTDAAATVLAPGRGMFVNKRGVGTTLVAFGEVRENQFVTPLRAGANLVGGGYPCSQAATGTGSRQMNSAQGFMGRLSDASADKFSVWKGDASPGATGYDDSFLYQTNAPPLLSKWVKVGDGSLAARDSELLFLGDGSVFIQMQNALNTYTMPCPWLVPAITTWAQWQAAGWAGEPLSGPNDDPDRDGTPNLLEYVFGTEPRQAGARSATPVEIVTVMGRRHVQITMPRLSERVAMLSVQVSSDLAHWDAGPAFTVEVSNTPEAWVVRDLTPLDAEHPQRFMRLQAEVPAP